MLYDRFQDMTGRTAHTNTLTFDTLAHPLPGNDTFCHLRVKEKEKDCVRSKDK